MGNSQLLVVSFVFPPFPGVGGRRWAKFSKYLAKKEIKVHVVHSKNPYPKKSTYLLDIVNSNIVTYPLNPRFPNYAPISFFDKIKTRIVTKYIQFYTKGNFYDRSLFWKKYFENEIPQIIEKNKIETVIISGGPFHYFIYGLQLQKKYPNIKFYFEYRDPWADFNVGYDDPRVGKGARYEYEKQLEISFLKEAKNVICVSDFQKQLLVQKDKQINSDKIIVIPNGFDKDDFAGYNKFAENTEKDVLKIIHVGTLNYEKADLFIPFLKAVTEFNSTENKLKVKVEFIGPVNSELMQFLDENKNSSEFIKVYGELSHFEANKKLMEADIALWFKYDRSPGDFATKYFEYIYLRKFIWVFSKDGEATQFIENNKIGKAFTDKKVLESNVLETLSQYEVQKPLFHKEFDSEKFSIENITEKIISIVKK